MKLLDRIAHSSGDLQRTVLALRLINQHLEHQLGQHSTHTDAAPGSTGLLARLGQTKSQQEKIFSAGPHAS